MSKPLPGLGDGPEVDVTVLDQNRKRTPVVLHAKWWMRPICWLRRKPTTVTVYR